LIQNPAPFHASSCQINDKGPRRAAGGKESPLKVLHFGRYYSQFFGGTERHVGSLLDCLQHRIQVTNVVASEVCRNEIVRRGRYEIHKIASVGTVAGTTFCPTMPFYVRDLHAREHFDIIHLHFPDPMSHLAYSFLPKGPKLVISWHSDIIRQKKLLALYQPFLNHVVAKADAIIAATPKHFTSSTQMNACRDQQRKHVVHYGVDLGRFEKCGRIDLGVKRLKEKFPNKRIIFSLGRHVYYKGYEYLIRSARLLPSDTILLLGGCGPKTIELQQLSAKLGLTNKVIFLGRIPDEELPYYYHGCEIFCMPSVEPSEAFGLVQMEAMACGKPIVCCELNNGVTYLNRSTQTGLVVPPRNSEALAAALNELLADDAKRSEYGREACARVRREFTLEQMTEGTLAVYRSILGSPNTPE